MGKMSVREKLQVMQEIKATNDARVAEWKKQNKIRGVLLDAQNGTITEKVIDRTDHTAYCKLLGCQTIDIVSRRVGEYIYDIVCDDEALLRDGPIPTGILATGPAGMSEPILFNSLFFAAFDGVEDLRSLTDAEVRNILQHTVTLTNTVKAWKGVLMSW